MRTHPILLVATLALAACEREPEPAEARAELCEDLAELHAAAMFLMNPPPTATVGDIREAREEFRDEMEDVREAAEELGEARHEAVMEAHDRLVEAIEELPDDATPAEAAAEIRAEAQAFHVVVNQARSEVRCPVP